MAMHHIRSLVLLPLALLLFSTMPLFAQSEVEPLPEFVDAERRVVYNLAHGLPRYEGVTIRYAFRMTSEVGWSTAEDVIATIGAHFDQVLTAELVPTEKGVLLVVETDGNLNNHDAYLQVLDLYGSSMAAHPRTYNLK